MWNNWLKTHTDKVSHDKNNHLNTMNDFETMHHTKIEKLESELDFMKHKLIVIEKQLDTLIHTHKCYHSLYNKLVERDQRELNFNIRGYAKQKAPAVPFVSEKSGVLFI